MMGINGTDSHLEAAEGHVLCFLIGNCVTNMKKKGRDGREYATTVSEFRRFMMVNIPSFPSSSAVVCNLKHVDQPCTSDLLPRADISREQQERAAGEFLGIKPYPASVHASLNRMQREAAR